MELAAAAAPAGVILTTDADAAPANSWVEANLQAVAAGADMVGGRIVGDPVEEARLGSGFLHRGAEVMAAPTLARPASTRVTTTCSRLYMVLRHCSAGSAIAETARLLEHAGARARVRPSAVTYDQGAT